MYLHKVSAALAVEDEGLCRGCKNVIYEGENHRNLAQTHFKNNATILKQGVEHDMTE